MNEIETVNETFRQIIWHKRFINLANLVATWSKDPSSKVGCVIVDENRRIVSTGYNGFPVGVVDSKNRLSKKDIKYKLVLHAEENAIMFAKRDLNGCSLYVTMAPCSHCAGLIIQSGIKHVYIKKLEISEKWKESFEYSQMMFSESKVHVQFIDMNSEYDML